MAFEITRVGIKNTGVRSTYLFEEEEPDFYSMPPVDASQRTTIEGANAKGAAHAATVSPNESPFMDIALPPLYSSADKPLLERLVDMQLDVCDEDKAPCEEPGQMERSLDKHERVVDGCTCCSLPSNQTRKQGRCCGCQLAHSEGDRIFFEGESFYYMDSILRDSDGA